MNLDLFVGIFYILDYAIILNNYVHTVFNLHMLIFFICCYTVLIFIISMLSCSVMSQFLVTPWTAAHQTPLSMGILQARILKWVALPSSRGSSQPRDWTQVSSLQADSLLSEPPGITTSCGKFLENGNTRPPYLCLEKPVCELRSNS